MAPRPQENVTVLDLTAALAGPDATFVLGCLDARVIKIENSLGPDSCRGNALSLEAMAQIAVPIHDDAGCAQDREAESQEKPDYFDSKAPYGPKMQGVHGPHEPIACGVILAVVPNAEYSRVGGVDGDDVAMRKVTWSAQIHLCVDQSSLQRWVANTEEPAMRRCLLGYV